MGKLQFRRIWTRNLVLTLVCHAFLAFHIGTFSSLWSIFLSAKRYDASKPSSPTLTRQSLPFSFTGGLGMRPHTIGLVLAILGFIGIFLQLFVYPTVNARLGTLRSYRYFLCVFPLAYCLAPYLVMIPSSTSPPGEASGALVWLGLIIVLTVHVVGRTFALPGAIILVNNSSPHPSVLGTVHGIAQSVSSAARTLGPVLGGWGFGKCLEIGVVGVVWFALAGVALVGWACSSLVQEGDGHAIWLEGEKDDAEVEKSASSMQQKRI